MEVEVDTTTRETRTVQHAGSLLHNRLSYAGMLLTLLSATHLVALLIVGIGIGRTSPYVGSLSYLVLPAILIPGLALMLLGAGLEHRRRSADQHAERAMPALPMRLGPNRPRHAGTLVVFSGAAVIALFTLGSSSYNGYEFLESTRFCAGVCHQQMQPEAIAHEDSAHSAVACSACHVGAGATYFVRSKLSGLSELATLLDNSYPRPIPAPADKLPAARATCEECHSPQKQYGNQILTRPHFLSDEKNTDRSIAVSVKTGGLNPLTGLSEGIHWHADPRNRVRYVVSPTDPQSIAWVSVTGPDGKTTEYNSVEHPISGQQLAQAEKREMDCLDCHNRQGHAFLNPDVAIDNAIAAGQIDRGLPYIRKVALDLVSRPYSTASEAEQSIANGIADFYSAQYPRLLSEKADAIQRSAESAEEVWARNVFPEMNITWGTYPDNVGHRNSPGCFRCHDEKHVSNDGKTISQDCSICHSLPVPKPSTPADLAAGGSGAPNVQPEY